MGELRLSAVEGTDPDLAVHVVDNGDLRLAFLPSVGGRLLSVCAGGSELLWRNPGYLGPRGQTLRPRASWTPLDGSMASWANVGGSKTWPAPQGWDGPGQWPGPPDPVLDSGVFSIDGAWDAARAELTVTMTSPVDTRTGLRVTREFVIPASGTVFRQRSTFVNGGAVPVTWSLWEVCQVDTASATGVGGDGVVRVSVEDDTEPVVLVEAVGSMVVQPVRGGHRTVPIQPVVAKVGFPSAAGLVEYLRPDGARISLRFSPGPGPYPDGGSRVELWMQCPQPEPVGGLGGLRPDAHLVELEVLSPAWELRPGGSASMDILWEATGPTGTG